MRKGKLFVISGPSGVGKGTVCRRILENDAGLRLSVSMTTRKPRKGEEHGVHYFFTDREAFRELAENDGFMEYADVFGNFYGTPKKNVMDWLGEGTDVILEIDVQGALKVQQSYPEGVFIFILPPSMQELRNRIRGRGTETAETMERRLGTAMKEIARLDRYDYGIVNDDLDAAVESVEAVIAAERCRIGEDEADTVIGRYKEEL